MSPEARITLPSTPRRATLLAEGLDRPEATAALVQHAQAIGHARGREEGETAQREAAAALLEQSAAALDTFAHEARANLARTAVELGCAIAERLLRRQVERGEADLERIVRETLQAASRERGACVVHLHPEDAALLEGVVFRSGTEIRADVDVARGDVHVETHQGLMVRELDGALDAIRERLLEELT